MYNSNNFKQYDNKINLFTHKNYTKDNTSQKKINSTHITLLLIFVISAKRSLSMNCRHLFIILEVIVLYYIFIINLYVKPKVLVDHQQFHRLLVLVLLEYRNLLLEAQHILVIADRKLTSLDIFVNVDNLLGIANIDYMIYPMVHCHLRLHYTVLVIKTYVNVNVIFSFFTSEFVFCF